MDIGIAEVRKSKKNIAGAESTIGGAELSIGGPRATPKVYKLTPMLASIVNSEPERTERVYRASRAKPRASPECALHAACSSRQEEPVRLASFPSDCHLAPAAGSQDSAGRDR